ncbi:hypothetical protein C3L33_22150, partial [Rhododendron williamsianum]
MQAFGLQLYMELQLASQIAEKKILKMQTLLCDMVLRLSTESLADAGYSGASILGDAICGMATARITSKDFLFWFRGHSVKEVKWGGAMHNPVDKDDDDGKERLDELSSVAGEMVRLIETASGPIFGVDSVGFINGWNAKIAELTRLQASEAMGKSLLDEIVHEDSCGVAENLICRALQGEEEKNVELKLQKLGQNEQKSDIYIMASACASRDYTNNVVGVCFVGQDITSEKVVMDKFIRLQVIGGQDPEKFPFGFFDRKGEYVEVVLMADKRTDEDGNIIGCFCFLQNVVSDVQAVGNKQEDGEHFSKLELDYIRQELKNPLYGIRFIHKLLEDSAVSEDQKQFLETSDECERQIISIIEDMDLRSIEEGSMELNVEEFLLVSVVDAIVSQVMMLSKEKNLQLVHEIPDGFKEKHLLGDQVRLQLVLSDFLRNIARYAPSPDGWVEIKVSPGLEVRQDGNELVHLQIRYHCR